MSSSDFVITSASNDLIKLWRSLDQRKYRDETGLFVVEGVRHVAEALAHGWQPRHLLALPDWQAPRDQQAIVAHISPELMERVSGKSNPPDVVGLFAIKPSALAAMGQGGLWVALEEIRDPGNLGTIMRTAAAAGASGIVLLGNCCDPWSSEAIRASVGAFTRLQIIMADLKDFAAQLKAMPCPVIGTHLTASADYRTTEYGQHLVLLMGSEHAGLSAEAVQLASHLVKIPMAGAVESLNVATATALVLYEARRAALHL
jgi:TrmH family RNA methyltransferase